MVLACTSSRWTCIAPYDSVTKKSINLPDQNEIDEMVAKQIILRKKKSPKRKFAGKPLTSLLCKSELKHLNKYRTLYRKKFGAEAEDDKNLVACLIDNPDNRITWSAGSSSLPTLKKSASKVWHFASGRWLTPKEMLASLGFPVYKCLAESAQCELLDIDSDGLAGMAGNSWQVGNAGVIMLTILACVEVPQLLAEASTI